MANFSIDKISTNLDRDFAPQLSEDYLVWQAETENSSSAVTSKDELFLYDFNSQTTISISNNVVRHTEPQISEGKVIWQGYQGNNRAIFVYDIDSASTRQIAVDRINNSFPQISGDNIVWQGLDNSSDSSTTNFNYQTGNSDRDPGSFIGINLGNSGETKRLSSNIAKINLASDLDISWARVSGGPHQWNSYGNLSPENFDTVIDYAEAKNINTYLYLEYRSDIDGGSIYDFDWYDVGRTYAQHFGDRVEAYGIINEPDHVVSGNSPKEVAFALEKFADGVHSVDSNYVVTSPGLGGTPMSIERTDDFLEAVAPLFNDGTLQVLNLHSYHDSKPKPHYSNIDLSSDFAPSNNFERAKEVGGITKNIDFIAGEFNYRNWQGTDEDRGIGFLTTLWNQLSVVGNDGKNDRVGLFSAPYTITGSGIKQTSMAEAFSFESDGSYTWQPNEKGRVLQETLTLTKGMNFVHTDPHDKGIVILKGNNRKMWVWQNRENFSNLHDDSTVRISGIPEDANGLAVYRWDSTTDKPHAMIETKGQTSISFNPADILPPGQTYMLMADSDNDGGNVGSIDGTTGNGADFIDSSKVTYNPDLDNDSVVTQNQEIFNYNLNSETKTQLTHSSINDRDPQVYGSNAVWRSENGNILTYNFNLGVTQRIATNAIDESPSIFDKNIVWRGNAGKIFTYNLQSNITQQIAAQSANIDLPDLSKEHLVWSANIDNGDREIFAYDFDSGLTTQITDNTVYDGKPQVSDNYVVWQGKGGTGSGGDREIFVYDLNTQQTVQVTNNNTDDKNPKISNNRIVWSGIDSNGGYEIFTVDLTEKPDNSKLGQTINGSGGRDNLNGGFGDDLLNGFGKQDRLNGNDGNDTLNGNDGNDILNGGAGDDLLIGNRGQDILTGGAGADTFAYNNLGDKKDIITDFEVGKDIIDLNKLFAGKGYNSSTPFDYIKLTQSGSDTIVKVNRNGNLSKPRYTDLIALQEVNISEIYQTDFDFG